MKKNVIIVGHSLKDANGLAYVSYLLLKKFVELKYDISYMNISTVTMDISDLVKFKLSEKINIINANVYDSKCVRVFDEFFETNPSELVITIHDPWLLDPVIYSAYRNSFFWVAYQTFEANIYPDSILAPTAVYPMRDKYKSLKQIFSSCDLVIPCSPIGCQALKRYDIEQNEFVYLGIDIFDRLEIDKLKEEGKSIFFNGKLVENPYIFMTLGVNNQRKKIDRTLTAFAEFLKTKHGDERKRFYLYLHSELRRNFNGTDILELIKFLGIENNVILEVSEVSKEILYKRYANIDCYISLYGAEGFGLPFVDALLFSKPVIYTDYSAPAEYCTNYGLPVKVDTYTYSSNFCLPIAIASIEDAVKKMELISSNPDDYNFNGYDYVCDKFDWNINFKKFYSLIQEKFEMWEKDVNKIKLPVKRIV